MNNVSSKYFDIIDNTNNSDIIRTNNDENRGRIDYDLPDCSSERKKDISIGIININIIYRFKFTEDFMKELYIFSKVHQYDERSIFKESWLLWVTENELLIISETERLLSLGYEGDIIDKMYKSARYYFRKKSTEKIEPKKRRQYIGVTPELLDAMDDHIKNHHLDTDYQPKKGFVEFCKDNIDILKESIKNICENGCKDSIIIEEKIKKTYKNRYFIFKNTATINK